MRKIEKEMLEALRAGKDWAKDNTMVKHEGNVAKIYLHGNHIATASRDTGTVTPIPATFSAWPTRTTSSRLWALGVAATIRKGLPHIDGVPVL